MAYRSCRLLCFGRFLGPSPNLARTSSAEPQGQAFHVQLPSAVVSVSGVLFLRPGSQRDAGAVQASSPTDARGTCRLKHFSVTPDTAVPSPTCPLRAEQEQGRCSHC